MPDAKRSTRVSVADPSYHRKLLQNLNKNRKDHHPTCDVRIFDREDHLFLAHKAVLAAASSYFDAMFSSNFVESTEARVDLPFSHSVTSAILEFIYSGKLEVDNEFALELLSAADFLLIDSLKGPIVNFTCADIRNVFNAQNIASAGIDASFAGFNVLKYFIEDEDTIDDLTELLESVEERGLGFETLALEEISNPLLADTDQATMVKATTIRDKSDRLPTGTNVYRIFSNRLYRFDGFGWTRVICPEFNEQAPSLRGFAVLDENGQFLTHNQDELRLFEMQEPYHGSRSPGDRSLKPFAEETISTSSQRLCFSENTIMALFTKPGSTSEDIYVWNQLSQSFQSLGDIWPLTVTYLDYIFEDSLQGRTRLFVVGNFKTLNDGTIANSVFSFNLCPISGALLTSRSVPVLPFINNSYIYHHFEGKLIAIPRIIGRNFCKDFYRFDENTCTWRVWEEAKLKVENRTILDVVSTKEYLYLVMSSFDHRWQNEFVQWNGHEFTDVTFSTSIPIEGKLLERISWIDYNVVDKVLKKARRLWL
ncbi:uncharacterized protein LOC108864975 [Galendromus occidentalis]|uniref:Uncharacterized protein LOC108864975 n=1 Tax=Galendromus occidentalis TaxID=34638 RepID=A0AAJ7L6B6_9ACAR|nr:uncharacterized protein LOC108864975 [Galendromus occidentalis]